MAREQDRAIEIVVRADIVSSIQQIHKDIDTIQEKLNGAVKDIFVNAKIKKIEIDKTAANYVKNELKKVFNTVTVDIDGNFLSFGEGTTTMVRKQTDSVQKAVSAAQKKLSNIKVDYGKNFSSVDSRKFRQFQEDIKKLSNDVNATEPDIVRLSDRMDEFAYAMLAAKKAAAENAGEIEAFAKACQRADKAAFDIEQNYLNKASDDQKGQYLNLSKQLTSWRRDSQNRTAADIDGIADKLDVLRNGIKLTAAESEKAAKAAENHAASLDKSMVAARTSLDAIRNKNWDTMTDAQKKEYSVLAREISNLRGSSVLTEEAAEGLQRRIAALGTETDKTASSVKAAAAASEKEAKALQSALTAFDNAWASVERMDLSGLTDEQKKAYREIKEIVDLVNADRGGASSGVIKQFTAEILRNKGDLQAMLANLKKVQSEANKTSQLLTQLDGVDKRLGGFKEKFVLDLSKSDLEKLKELQGKIAALKDPAVISTQKLRELKAEIDAFMTGVQTKQGRESNIASQINAIVTQIERIQNIGGDTQGLNLTGVESVQEVLRELYKTVLAYQKELPNGVRKLIHDMAKEFQNTGKIDLTKVRELARAFETPELAAGTGYEKLTNRLALLAVKAGQAADAVDDLHHEMSDNSRSQGFQNRVNDDIRKLDEFYEKHTKLRNNKAFSDEYQTIRAGFDVKASEEAIKKNEDAMKDYIHRAKEAGLTTDTLGEKIRKAYQKFGGWAIVSGTFMRVTQAIRDMINNVVQLDKNLTELKKVTSETSNEYDAFLQRTKASAKEIGATMNDVVSATADFARLGYSVEDAEELAKVALLYNNVGDGLDGIDEATSNIISTMQGFSIDSSEAMKLVDLMNAISNTESITSGGLGEALRRSSSAMAAAGNTLTQTMALITSANSVLQDPETVGKVSCPAA